MAARAIRAKRLLVHILVTGNTICAGLRKNQIFVATPAIYVRVLAL